jgi:hypothetical protein
MRTNVRRRRINFATGGLRSAAAESVIELVDALGMWAGKADEDHEHGKEPIGKPLPQTHGTMVLSFSARESTQREPALCRFLLLHSLTGF